MVVVVAVVVGCCCILLFVVVMSFCRVVIVVGMVVGFVVGFGVGGVVGCVIGAVCEGDFGAGTTVAEVGGFVAGGWLVVFGVGVVVGFVVVGGGVVDVVKTSPISPIAINAADKISDVLIGGLEFGVVVVDVEGVVDCCGCGCGCCC